MIYLDNCSTTKPRDSVIEKITESMQMTFGNPSSLHGLGMSSEKILKSSRKTVADFLGVKTNEIYFTSGGTEGNNIAIQGALKARENRGKHIITTMIEHPAVMNTIKEYEKNGYLVSWIPNGSDGRIDLDKLEEELTDQTVLVSVIHVNNEIGTIQDIETIGKLLSKQPMKPHFHLDGVQSFGKIKFSLISAGVDSFAFSGHKIHGPKGVGALYINSKARVNPLVFGGNQEMGMRSGTENVPGIAGFSEAVRVLTEKGSVETQKIADLKESMTRMVLDQIDDVIVNSPSGNLSSPYILNLSFGWTRGEVILHYLEEENIYVSTTSACSSKGTDKSHVLKAIGLDDNHMEGTLRLCFSYEMTDEDVARTVQVLKNSVEEVRSIMRR
ncbi:cysteine desulfurase family protein [Gudongella sp. DL1XJH-153]|uniref:cysteine desulfurase family protein n=1 Tax=Gudongella sp. DL1XJH-153 TaxID=3409804 RepID=UPI003BB6EACC